MFDGWTLKEVLGADHTLIGLIAIVVLALVVHEPWRWLGLYVGSRIAGDSAALELVRAIATAMIAGLVMRLLLFPAGALADVPVALRVGALAAGVVAFFATHRHLGAGVGTAAMALVVGMLIY
ncbi:MAG: AzlD domain-containing protein [Pseudomonadota bacterium]